MKLFVTILLFRNSKNLLKPVTSCAKVKFIKKYVETIIKKKIHKQGDHYVAREITAV